ncbi:MAG TPA: alpha/beta hydrolase-fold protein [Bryobacteraceae bacterium]|nr:alpha/beta hydrolase-fold protein [Bryobacteraceae bacterium]
MGILWLATAAWAFQAAPKRRTPPPAPSIPTPAASSASTEEQTLQSEVLGGTRSYRVFLPPAYNRSQKRYPVIYWLYGYEQPNQEREKEISAYIATHDVILIYAGPVETSGNFPLYFPELVDHIDHTLRTVADRDHRAVTGYAVGGFLALYTAGKYPNLVGSASSFLGMTESPVGPEGFEVDYRLHEIYANYDGVRTRLVADPREPAHFYDERLNGIWLHACSNHETVDFDRQRATEAIPGTFDFHMHAFAAPLPKPAVFNHWDAYPNFAVWGWEVASTRRQPGFTMLDQVSAKGFRSAVRQWAPGGATIPEVKLSLASAPLYAPGSTHPVTIVRLRDGETRHVVLRADPKGRLNFDLNGDAYQVGIGEEAALTVSGWQVQGAAWATASQPDKIQVRFLNAGAVRSATGLVRWESPDRDVKFEPASSRLFGLGPEEAAPLAVTVTVADATRPIVRIVAAMAGGHVAFDVPLFPPSATSTSFQIADGRTVSAWRHGTAHADAVLGEGNRDGQAAPGETFVVLLPDGEALRPAEVFSNDSCLDTGMRGSDSWDDYDHQLASFAYSVISVPESCEPGHVLHALARIVTPAAGGYQTRYEAIEFPVWWRHGQEPHNPPR